MQRSVVAVVGCAVRAARGLVESERSGRRDGGSAVIGRSRVPVLPGVCKTKTREEEFPSYTLSSDWRSQRPVLSGEVGYDVDDLKLELIGVWGVLWIMFGSSVHQGCPPFSGRAL